LISLFGFRYGWIAPFSYSETRQQWKTIPILRSMLLLMLLLLLMLMLLRQRRALGLCLRSLPRW
jgi:hypothetical protein